MKRTLLALWIWAPLCGAATSYDYTTETQSAAKTQGVVTVGKTSNAGLVPKVTATAKPKPAAPAKAAAKGEIRTSPLTFSGTGKPVLGTRGTANVRMNTPPLAFSGTGKMPTRTAIAPVRIDTPPLSFTGNGRL